MGKKYYAGNAGYPAKFKGFRSLRQQAQVFEAEVIAEDDQGERLEGYLDGSRLERLAANVQVPPGWDGVAVVPKPHKLAPLYRGQLKGFQFNQAYAHLLQILMHRMFLRSDPGLAFVTDQDRRLASFYQVCLAQPGDYMVFAAQLGRVHRDRAWATRADRLASYEIPLDPYLAGCLLLSHPERLESVEASPICCPGAHLRQDPSRLPSLCKTGIQLDANAFTNVCLQVKHFPADEPAWLATARFPGM